MALTPAQQREMLELSFEQAEHGFVYYHYRWSRGIPVTAEERDEYLTIPVFGSRRAWRRSLAGRETTPPRAYRPVARKLLKMMPLSMAIYSLFFGVVGLILGFNEANMAPATVYVAVGCAMLFFGGSIVAARRRAI
ncbi:MAG: hypothetical protein CVT77_06195 [Alphaproteobacteria bacterium HGW-Alphaproteobacteria-16]|nr:MAG: hypothetical protein CVT77_06195 [Alphaproteobacteria bacterium HGW-Alphaproteobacteria-16]